MRENATDILNRICPASVRVQMNQAVFTGYEYVRKLYHEIGILNCGAGLNLVSHLKNAAVEFELERLSKLGKLPFNSYSAQNNGNNHAHLELRDHAQNVVITIARVKREKTLPRRACFRQTLNASNGQLSLFEADNLMHDNVDFHILLTHGYRASKPEFVCIGMPSIDNTAWLDRVRLDKLRIVEQEFEVEETNYQSFKFASKVKRILDTEDDLNG